MRSERKTDPAHDGAQRRPACAACFRTSFGATLDYHRVIVEVFPCK